MSAMKPHMKTSIVIDLPDHIADAVVELSKTIDLSTLLRAALGEFASRRTPAKAYIEKRYGSQSLKFQSAQKKIDEVERRIAFAKAIHSGVARVETIKLPELKECQGINNYKEGWYVQINAGFQCEHGDGHDVEPGEKMHVDAKGHIHCEAHATMKKEAV
jgi:hypothetical protein